MNEHEFLERFQKVLRDEEYDSSLIEATDVVPDERLLVFLGIDEREREKILEVTALQQEFFKELRMNELKEPDIFRIQFQVVFPFNVEPKATNQMASLICYLNRLIEIPGFEMNEIDLQLSYRYILMYGEKKFNQKLLLSIIGLIMLLIELFGSTLEEVAQGKKTFNDLLEQIIALGQQLK